MTKKNAYVSVGDAIFEFADLTKITEPEIISEQESTEPLTKAEAPQNNNLEEKMALFVSVFYHKVCREFFTEVLKTEPFDFKTFMRLNEEEEALFEKYLLSSTTHQKQKEILNQ